MEFIVRPVSESALKRTVGDDPQRRTNTPEPEKFSVWNDR